MKEIKEMQIRKIGMEQFEEIQGIIEDAFSAEPWCDDWADRRQFALYIADLVDNTNSLALGLYEGDRIIAVALGRIIHWFEGNQYRIDDLGVCSAMQGRGTGSLFLEKIGNYAAENDIQAITLKTNRHAGAYRFYLKNGFEEFTDDVYFEKKIAEPEHH